MEGRSVTKAVALPKINTLNMDVFTMILQELIDEEADAHMDPYNQPSDAPKAAVTFSLVCKRWKNIVYLTPSFWFIIKLSMDFDSDEMQAKLDRAVNRARNVPIDLHISNIHSHSDQARIIHSNNCCCKNGSTGIGLDFTGVTKVRRFKAHFTHYDGFSMLDPSSLPFLKYVKWVEFRVWVDRRAIPQPLDIANFLHYSHNITYLGVCCLESHNLRWARENRALMPYLRTLFIHSGNWDQEENLVQLARILSHTPNLEELVMEAFWHIEEISTPVPAQLLESVKCFPNLRKIRTNGIHLVNWLFTDSGIAIPNLHDFRYSNYGAKSDDSYIDGFFMSHQSIRKVTMRKGADYPCVQHLHWALNVEELAIQGVYQQVQWLADLYTPIIDENTNVQSYICPNLRVITIFDYDNSILQSLLPFEEFVRVRCQPVDEDSYTAAGCRAIEVLKVELSRLSVLREEKVSLSNTDAWKRAKVWKSSNGKYELRWHPELISPAMNSEPLEER